ncbi:LCT family protein [Megaselia abdita]
MIIKYLIFTSSFLFYGFKAEQLKIPENFSIGVATSAYQIEGGWNEDGKGESIWDTFIHNFPDKIKDKSNGDIACDSYHKFDKDLHALINLKVNHYRFSISWNRILSNGLNSTFNKKGVEYYNYVIDKLIEHKITPMVTMFHFDMPNEFMKSGGMTNPKFLIFFETYSELLFQLFGDRVKTWITFNEASIYCMFGYGLGIHAPGIKESGVKDYLCIHNLLKAHAVTYKMYSKKFYKIQKGRVGIAIESFFYFSKSNDSLAVYRAFQYGLGIVAHPIFSKTGGYPEVVVEEISKKSILENRNESRLPHLSDYWKNLIRGSADFLALNYYTSRYIEEDISPTWPNPSNERDIGLKFSVDPSWKRSTVTFWIYSVPKGLENLLKFIRDEYDNVEVIITENGWSDDGDLNDNDRVEYLGSHLEAILNAIEDGCNVTGYTAWSLMDNFEWASGYR